MPIPKDILDGIAARSVTFDAFTDEAVIDSLRILLDLEGEIRGLIAVADVGNETRVTFRRARLKRLLEQTRGSIAEAYRRIGKITDPLLRKVAETELGFSAQLVADLVSPLGGAAGVAVNTVEVSPNLLKSLARDTVVNMGESLGAAPMRTWLQAQSSSVQAMVSRQLIRGIQIGEGTATLMRRLVRGPGGTAGVLGAAKHTIESLVRTSTLAVVTEARTRQFKENAGPDGVLNGVVQLSTLDKRTSRICIAYAGKKWRYTEKLDLVPVEHSLPYLGGPPRHPRCRSISLPWTKSWREMGISENETSPAMRRIFDGKTTAPTGDEILRRGGRELQDAVLGKTRSDLWRAGKLKVDDLVKRGAPTTLADLGK